jgi:hypothetical protein
MTATQLRRKSSHHPIRRSSGAAASARLNLLERTGADELSA